MSPRWRLLSHIAFGMIAAATLLFTGEVCLGVFKAVGKPFVGFSHTQEGFVNPVGLEVWGADQAGVLPWDRIVAVDGEVAFGGHMIRQLAFTPPLGRDVIYQLEGVDGSVRFARIPSRLYKPSDVIRSHASQALLGLVFVVIAILLYFLRPGTLEAWSFFGFFSTVGMCMSAVVNETVVWRFPTLFGYLAPFMALFGLILVGALSRAYTWRLENDAAGLYLRRLMWTITIGGLLISVIIAGAFHHYRGDIRGVIAIDDYLYAWLAIATGTGLTALVIAYRRGRSPRRRAKIRQILWAIPVGAGIPTANLFLGSVLETTNISFLWNGFVILLPLATADAVVRHDLLHLNITARRLVGGITVAAVMGMGLGFVLWAVANLFDVGDAAATVALAALLFAGAAPITHRVQRYVESLLRSRRYDPGRLLADFTARASTALHLAQVTEILHEILDSSVEPSRVQVYRLSPSGHRLFPQTGEGDVVEVDDDVRVLLDRAGCAIFDEDDPAPAVLGPAAIALRLAVANDAVGMLVLDGRKDSLAYEGPDVAFVESLAGPLAAALVNSRAYEEVRELNRSLEERVEERTAELAQTNIELERLNARKDELVATVSHDFRSPLAIIRQNVQTIMRDLNGMDEEDMRHFLEGVARQEERLTSMCESLLDLARLKQQPVYDVEVDLFEIAQNLAEGYTTRAEDKGVRLSVERAPGADTIVHGDAERLSQVLQNLVDNAIKFTPEGGRVVVRLSPDTRGTVRMEVEDSGCGVPAAQIERLFEPFYQVPRQSHVGQGSGLGLAIVKAVVESHGGEISVASEEDRGTVFTLRFPLAAPAEPAAGATEELEASEGGDSEGEAAAAADTAEGPREGDSDDAPDPDEAQAA
jgi:signal transduction histidine kinase